MRVFEAENGNQIVALTDVQADAFIQAGLTEVGGTQKRTRKEQATE